MALNPVIQFVIRGGPIESILQVKDRHDVHLLVLRFASVKNLPLGVPLVTLRIIQRDFRLR